MPRLAITTCATKSYCYAMKTLGRRVAACLAYAQWTEPGVAIIAGDSTKEVKDAVKAWKSALPKDWIVEHLYEDTARENLGDPNYKEPAQILIARLRSMAFTAARVHQPEICWSLDSDTLPPANALQCMLDSLHFDHGYYSVATCPYPNEAFLGGFGTQFNPIAEDFLESERTVPDELAAELKVVRDERAAMEKEAQTSKEAGPTDEQKAKWKALEEKLHGLQERVKKECPPTGNVWEVIAKHGWRRRGWLDQAYPAIGLGAMVPSDWCGFGCTLMNRDALALADFDGYQGQGTEDLYVVWHRWYPAKLRINVITHCPCDHVIWARKKGGAESEYTLIRSFHEEHGECRGHLRTRKTPWREF